MQSVCKALFLFILLLALPASIWRYRRLSVEFRIPNPRYRSHHKEYNNHSAPKLHVRQNVSLPEAPHTLIPTVCILIPTTSSTQEHWSAFKDTFLFNYPLSSLYATCELGNFTYRILIGYDTDDRLFNNQTLLNTLYEWASLHIPSIALDTYSISNPRHKPGPAMNFLSKQAHSTGCTYLYRINDDTEFKTPWTSAFVSTLASFSPPNIGVVGPTCHEGNTAIMTHDFVHRSHIDIFGTHYPPELTDWWLDDWISLVYGDDRTLKLPHVTVLHHVIATRYEVTWSSMKLLKTLVEQGNQTLSVFVSNKHIGS